MAEHTTTSGRRYFAMVNTCCIDTVSSRSRRRSASLSSACPSVPRSGSSASAHPSVNILAGNTLPSQPSVPAATDLLNLHSLFSAFLAKSAILFCLSHSGVSEMAGLSRICAIDRAHEISNTARHLFGSASLSPIACVIIKPMTIANCVRTPGRCESETCVLSRSAQDQPTLPRILGGAISDRKMGPTQRPIPAPTPVSSL